MKNLKYIALTVALFIALPLVGGAGAAAYMQYGPCSAPGSMCVVGDIRMLNNGAFSDWNTAIAEEASILLDGSAGELEFGPGDTTAPDVVLSRDAANRLHLGTADDFVMEGTTADAYEFILDAGDPSQDITATVPDATSGVYTFGDITISHAFGGTAADHLDTIIFVADRAYTLTDVNATWGTAESTGSMDIMVEKLVGVTACASGTDMLSAVIDATATAGTTTAGTLHGTAANLNVAAGDTICLDLTATPNEIVNLVVTLGFRID